MRIATRSIALTPHSVTITASHNGAPSLACMAPQVENGPLAYRRVGHREGGTARVARVAQARPPAWHALGGGACRRLGRRWGVSQARSAVGRVAG